MNEMTSAENASGHWGDAAQSEWHIGTPGECAVPTCTAPPPCPCLPGAPPHDCGAGGYATDPPYICYPCSKGEHAEPARCGEHYARHPELPHLVAVCALPSGHDGEHSNVLPKPGGSDA